MNVDVDVNVCDYVIREFEYKREGVRMREW